jgi:DNA-binding MarR family transcriptional regulator
MNLATIAVLDALKARPGSTCREIADATGIYMDRVQSAIKRGRAQGVVDSERMHGYMNRTENYLVGEPIRSKQAQVLAAIAARPSTRVELRQRLPEISANTINVTLRSLERDEIIVETGQGRPLRFAVATQQAAK